jgi:hypothetical protein
MSNSERLANSGLNNEISLCGTGWKDAEGSPTGYWIFLFFELQNYRCDHLLPHFFAKTLPNVGLTNSSSYIRYSLAQRWIKQQVNHRYDKS